MEIISYLRLALEYYRGERKEEESGSGRAETKQVWKGVSRRCRAVLSLGNASSHSLLLCFVLLLHLKFLVIKNERKG